MTTTTLLLVFDAFETLTPLVFDVQEYQMLIIQDLVTGYIDDDAA